MKIRGVDTMLFGLDIYDYKKEYEPFLLELKEKKDYGHQVGSEQYVNYNDLLFKVGLTGIRFYAYKISCKDFMVAFAEKTTDTNSEIMVKFSSGYLWSYGYSKAYEKFIDWFKNFPGTIKQSRLSRLDICVDTDEISFEEEDIKKFTSRANSISRHFVSDEYYVNGKLSGFTIGRGNPMLARIYNKTNEINTKGKPWFKIIWAENGWDGKTDVWRIEFQLRREVLKELGINSVEDINRNEDALWNYLTQKWLILNHHKWEVVENTGNPNITSLVRKKVIEGDIERLTNQIKGLLISVGAYGSKSTLDEILKHIKNRVEMNLKKKGTTYEKEVLKRRSQFLKQKGNETI